MEYFDDFTKPYIFVSGEGMLIEGVSKICVWEELRIVVICREKITVTGENLTLDYKGQRALLLKGKISALEFSSC